MWKESIIKFLAGNVYRPFREIEQTANAGITAREEALTLYHNNQQTHEKFDESTKSFIYLYGLSSNESRFAQDIEIDIYFSHVKRSALALRTLNMINNDQIANNQPVNHGTNLVRRLKQTL